MGINICVYLLSEEGQRETELPESVWDWFRHAGDREIGGLISRCLPVLEAPGREGEWQYLRPADFGAWRKAFEKLENKERALKLLDVLTERPNAYVYLSW